MGHTILFSSLLAREMILDPTTFAATRVSGPFFWVVRRVRDMDFLAHDLRLAFRNVTRHKRRSAIALSAVGFGILALILANSFIEWILWATKETTIHSELGHIQVTQRGYLEAGAANPFGYLIPENAPVRNLPEQLRHVRVVAPRLSFSGLVSHGEATVSFIGEGVVAEAEAAMHRAHRLSRSVNIVQGEDLSAQDPNGIVMGEGLAANLGVKSADTVVLLANTASGSINAIEVKIRGIFSTISKAFDDSALRVPRSTAQALLRTSGDHRLVVLLDQTERTDEVLAQLRERLAGASVELTPWYALSDFYNKTVTLFAKQAAVVKLIIASIIVLSISNTLLMSVLERTGEIGTSMALGVNRLRILRQFLLEGGLLGIFGGAVGVLAGILSAQLISAIGIPMPAPPGQSWGYSAEMRVTWTIIADSFALAVLTALLASAYPAWKASRLEIVDALRFNR